MCVIVERFPQALFFIPFYNLLYLMPSYELLCIYTCCYIFCFITPFYIVLLFIYLIVFNCTVLWNPVSERHFINKMDLLLLVCCPATQPRNSGTARGPTSHLSHSLVLFILLDFFRIDPSAVQGPPLQASVGPQSISSPPGPALTCSYLAPPGGKKRT